MIDLRSYQTDAIEAVYNWMGKNDGNALVVMPTGTGKSVVLAGIASDAVWNWEGTRVLVLSHVRELLTQDYAQLLRLWPEAPAGLYSAGLNRRDIDAQILVAGIQSIHRHAYRVQRCDLVLVDEAHLIGRNEAGMYRRFLGELKSINPEMRVIGLTATHYRLDTGLLHEGEGALFDGIAYHLSLLRMVREGYLSEVRSQGTDTKLDVSAVGSRGGEFIPSQLEAAVDKDDLNEAAVKEIVAAGADRGSWLVFCSGVLHAEHVRDTIRRAGVSCEMVTGDTPTVQRDRIIADFRNGRLRAVTNMNVLSTGFDVPGVDLIAMLRPTKSASLYVQMLGRGMRTAEGKENCILLDFAGNAKRHGVIDRIEKNQKVHKTTDPDEEASEPSKNDEQQTLVPAKECPTCKSLVPARALQCADCGFEWPKPEPKFDRKPSAAPVLSIHTQPSVWIEVSDVSYARHTKAGKPDSLVVNYQCGLMRHREWVLLEHVGYPREKAVAWWQRRAPTHQVPYTVTDALEQVEHLAKPTAITIRPEGQYVSISGVKFA